MSKEELYKKIADAVIDMDDETVESLCHEAIDSDYDATEVIREGLIKGMDKVGEYYATGEYFLPEVLTASFALNAGVDILKPYMKKEVSDKPVKIVIGVVEGDTHDIGKNLVKIMCESAGFDVIDLGRDVPITEFVDTAEKENADFILLSTLMTTTMVGMKAVVDELVTRGIRDKYKVMIGGGPISQKFCDEIGADAYTVDAVSCVKKIKEIVGI